MTHTIEHSRCYHGASQFWIFYEEHLYPHQTRLPNSDDQKCWILAGISFFFPTQNKNKKETFGFPSTSPAPHVHQKCGSQNELGPENKLGSKQKLIRRKVILQKISRRRKREVKKKNIYLLTFSPFRRNTYPYRGGTF